MLGVERAVRASDEGRMRVMDNVLCRIDLGEYGRFVILEPLRVVRLQVVYVRAFDYDIANVPYMTQL